MLDLFFAQFLDILSHKTREIEKLPILESLAKSLEDEELQMKNHNKTIANYAKRFTRKRAKLFISKLKDFKILETNSVSKHNFCEEEYALNKCSYL